MVQRIKNFKKRKRKLAVLNENVGKQERKPFQKYNLVQVQQNEIWINLSTLRMLHKKTFARGFFFLIEWEKIRNLQENRQKT